MMALLESVLDAFAVACDVWLSSGGDEECPTAEFAPLVRQTVCNENAELRELVRETWTSIVYSCNECYLEKYIKHSGHPDECDNGYCDLKQIADRMRELGIEVGE